MTTALRRDAARNRELVIATARAMRLRSEPLQLNAVARQAGLGVATVYRHFETVDQLTETLVLERFIEMENAVSAVTTYDELRAFLGAALATFADDEDFATIATASDPALAPTREARSALLDSIAAAFARLRTEVALAPNLDTGDVLVLLCGLGNALRHSAPTNRTDAYLDAFLGGAVRR